ncbi:CGNR zinc finger domain-containing protein [Chitinasiproducens palmae]|uniref:Conserved protein containing a Zn-ribbon-like motif, possibly RNA-binding n=1 Tax=Chitinasiproducens palmae TaxID=1770053 RepID=A0A1H2PJD4_9BURK|nr:ABATE domain-containing protein [Chitinasiproducens palmae]SDV46425.1 Conserved protein containing a Zn-ribbon-like motif, possibly RNA-binding [Chitinasiproducens palmae]
MTQARQTTTDGRHAPMLGDHLAMDLLNTEARVEGTAVDYWQHEDEVLAWLARYGIAPVARLDKTERADLLSKAKTLRAAARRLVGQSKDGKVGDASALHALNAYLQAYVTAPRLQRDKQGKLSLARTACSGTVAALLGPVAEAVSDLLIEGDFTLVKQCEHPDCVLWFYDRTKAHKRRWCSMATCGNRFKAAQFRQRNQGAVRE